MMPQVHEDVLTKEQWEQRRTRLDVVGASDVPVILGLVPQRSAYTLWAQKRGLIERDAENIPMRVGHALEPLIEDLYHEKTGRTVINPGDYTVYTNLNYPWVSCTPDRLAVFEDKNIGPVEFKTSSVLSEWNKDDPPLKVIAQHQVQMAVLDMTQGSIAGLIGNREFVCFDQQRNDRLIAGIMRKVKDFVDLCVSGEPPAVDGSESTWETLKAMHPADNGETVSCDLLSDDAARYLEIDAAMKELKAEQQEVKNRIANAIGDNTFGMFGDLKFSFKHSNRLGYTVEPCEYRALRVVKSKGGITI